MNSYFVMVAALLCLFGGSVRALPADLALAKAIEAAQQKAQAPLIARQDFLKSIPVQQVSLSPDGQYLVYQRAKERHVELWRYAVNQQQHQKLLSTKQLSALAWSADSRKLFYRSGEQLVLADISKPNHTVQLFDLSQKNIELLGADTHAPAVFWLSEFDPQFSTYRLMRLEANKAPKIHLQSRFPFRGLLTDKQGQAILIKVMDGLNMHINEVNQGVQTRLFTCIKLDPCNLHHWDEQSRQLLLSAHFEQDLLSLFLLDADTGSKTLVHQDPQRRFDLHTVVLNGAGAPVRVSYQNEYYSHFGLTENGQATLDVINAKSGSRYISVQHDKQQRIWLVTEFGPAQSVPHYWLLDAQSGETQQPFRNLQGQSITPELLASKVSFWYPASDGKPLHGYVTLPNGHDPASLPLVVKPHGGPWTRDNGSYNKHSQFLANRGYVVFEPNFRGSTGFGRDYMFSANKDFGNGRVQQDIIDGVDYLLAHGIGNKAQQAIVGHSFGGFSALNALAFTPERFKMAFAGAAPVNLTNSVRVFTKNPRDARDQMNILRFNEVAVDIENLDDVERLYRQSPDKHWRNIHKPLYLWAGGQDNKVAVTDVRDLALRLKNEGRVVTLVSDAKAGHSPQHPVAREAYFYLLESSLAKHIHGRFEADVSPALQRYLTVNAVMDTNQLLADFH